MTHLFVVLGIIWVVVAVIDIKSNKRETVEAFWWPVRTALKIIAFTLKVTTFIISVVPGWKEPMLRFAEYLEKWRKQLKDFHDPK